MTLKTVPLASPLKVSKTFTPWNWAMAGVLLGTLVTLLMFAPAQWLAQAVALASQDRLQLQEARGTVWQGSAQVVLTGPAALLTGLGAPWNTLQPEGDLAIVPQQLSLNFQNGRWRTQGRLQLTARDMASRLSPLKPIGSYQVDLSPAAAGAGAGAPVGAIDLKLSSACAFKARPAPPPSTKRL